MGAECRYELGQGAYIKLALHALKHSSSAVNGLLIGRLRDGTGDGDRTAVPTVVVTDAVPLSHSHLALLPALEIALTQVEEHFGGDGMSVVGYYHANERYDDADLSNVAKKIGDHIFRYFPRAAVLLIDNKKIEELLKEKGRELVVQLYTRDSSRSWRRVESDGSSQLTIKEPAAYMVLADYIATQKWHDVFDFDDHLEDISKDWLNPNLFK